MTFFSININQRLCCIFEIDHSGHAPFRAMEGLRGLAVTLVFLVHYVTLLEPWLPSQGGTHDLASGLRSIGHAGVDLFFVLSGFLIYGTLIVKDKPFLPYIWRRIERLYPTFLVVLAIYLFLSILFPNESKLPNELFPAANYLLANLLLLPGVFEIAPIITVAWSLSYEMFFYLVIPLIISCLRLRSWSQFQRMALFLSIAALIMALNLFHAFYVRIAMFAAGMLLWDSLSVGLPKLDKVGLWALAIGILCIYTLHDSDLPGVLRYVVLFVTFYLLCAACLGQRGVAYRWFCWRPMRWLGNMSYSYYLIHGLTLKAGFLLLGRMLPPDPSQYLFWILLLPMFSATLLMGAGLFVIVERPISLESRRSRKDRYSFLSNPVRLESK